MPTSHTRPRTRTSGGAPVHGSPCTPHRTAPWFLGRPPSFSSSLRAPFLLVGAPRPSRRRPRPRRCRSRSPRNRNNPCGTTSASGAPDDSSLSHFSAMTRPCWLRRAVMNRHRHAIEQASRRWRRGRRDDSARACRKNFDFHTGHGTELDPPGRPQHTHGPTGDPSRGACTYRCV